MDKKAPHKPNPRHLVFQVVTQVVEKKVPLDSALEKAFHKAPALDARDRAFVKNLVTTLFRVLPFLDKQINGYLKKPLPMKALWVKNWLRIGATQILFLDVPDHAAVNSTVEAVVRTKKPAAKTYRGLTNAILRNLTREKDQIKKELEKNPALILPNWIKKRWQNFYGQEVDLKVSKVLLDQPPLDLTLRDPDKSAELIKALGAEEIFPGVLRFHPSGKISDLPGFREGQWWVQDLAAGLPVYILGDIAGKTVLDLCAAPGGKTMMLAARGAKVTAVDISKDRLEKLKANLSRTGLKAEVVTSDVLKLNLKTKFDVVLLDAPCSSSGTLRRHPDVAIHRNSKDLERLASLQGRLLEKSLDFLKPNGVFIYCVCSLEKEEGEAVISNFLETHPKISRTKIGPVELEGHSEWVTKDGDIRTLPYFLSEKGGMDGFFISRLTF